MTGIVLNPGTGGSTVRTVSKAGGDTQVVTLDLGGAGAESLIAGALPVTQSGTWNIGSITTMPTTPVTGTFFQATQPVSAASLPLPAGASTETTLAALNTKVTAVNTGAVTISAALPTGTNTIGAVTGPAAAPLALNASITGHLQVFKDVTASSVLSVANTAATITLAAVAAQFHYITRIRIVNVNPTITAIAAAASTLSYTTTNLPGTLAWSAGTLLAAGAEKVVVDEVLAQPLKSSVVNTATTIVAPAIGAGGLVRITVYYYTAA